MGYWIKFKCNNCSHEWTAEGRFYYCEKCAHPDIVEIDHGYESDY